MDGNTTVKYLQKYLREKDLLFLSFDSLPPGEERQRLEAQAARNFFLKLVEEVGEVSEAIFCEKFRKPGQPIKGTLDEELWDVMYFVLCLANIYGVDMEETIREKEQLNNLRFHDEHPFQVGR